FNPKVFVVLSKVLFLSDSKYKPLTFSSIPTLLVGKKAKPGASSTPYLSNLASLSMLVVVVVFPHAIGTDNWEKNLNCPSPLSFPPKGATWTAFDSCGKSGSPALSVLFHLSPTPVPTARSSLTKQPAAGLIEK